MFRSVFPALVTAGLGLSVLQSPLSSFRTLPPHSVATPAEARIESNPISLLPQAHAKGGAAAILKEAGYDVCGSIGFHHVDSDDTKFVLASGCADHWLALSELFEGVHVYDPTGTCPPPERHEVITFFATGFEDAELHLNELAYARDHASNIRGHDVIACAFISLSQLEEEYFVDVLLSSRAKQIAEDRGIVIFGGEVLGLVADLADERTAREAAETKVEAIAKVVATLEDTDQRAAFEKALGAGTTNDGG